MLGSGRAVRGLPERIVMALDCGAMPPPDPGEMTANPRLWFANEKLWMSGSLACERVAPTPRVGRPGPGEDLQSGSPTALKCVRSHLSGVAPRMHLDQISARTMNTVAFADKHGLNRRDRAAAGGFEGGSEQGGGR